MSARSPLKWPGGKGKLVKDIVPHLPPTFGRYFEPFAGGASLFFALQPTRAVLSDANEELVTMYRTIRDHVEILIRDLSAMHDRYHDSTPEQRAAFYYEVRDERPVSPARMIFLNRTGFNGLYRVNRDGGFNVPHGRIASGKPPVICDPENLRACSAALRGVEIVHQDFRSALTGPGSPEARDLVYLDSPYEVEPGKKSFTGYTPGGASPALQSDLAAAFRHLVKHGVHVVASNSDTPRIRELYSGFRMIELSRPGGMNSDPAKRQRVRELLILGRGCP